MLTTVRNTEVQTIDRISLAMARTSRSKLATLVANTVAVLVVVAVSMYAR